MKKINLIIFLIIGWLLFVIVYKPLNHSTVQPLNQRRGNMKITSVFENNQNIPSEYTCDGKDAQPEITISEAPANAKSLVLIVDDPDAPMKTFVHWLLYNIPASTTKISAQSLPEGSKQGVTDFGRVGWGGPCPPSGMHRYFFKLYALDKILELPEGASEKDLENAMKDHVIEKAELIGLYKRK